MQHSNKGLFFAWFICLLAAFFYSYDFLLRVMPSVMLHPLMHTYGANATQIGLLSAFYYYAYTPLQLPSGVVMDKYPSRWVLTVSALLCALGAILFSLTENFSLAIIARIMMGVGSAFAFVGALKLGAILLPAKRFALFSSITVGLGILGAVLADNILSHMVADIGWQASSLWAGIMGLLLAGLLFLFVRDKPVHLSESIKPTHTWQEIGGHLWKLACHPVVWINGIIGALLFLPISVFASLWGVDFLARRFAISATHAASAVSLVFIGTAVASPLVGFLFEKLKGAKLILLFGHLGCIALVSLLVFGPNLSLTMAYGLLFGIGLFTAPQALIFTVAKKLSAPGTTGMSTAMTNFIVTLGAAFFQPFIGFALDLNWQGQKSSLGTPIFSISNYQFALSLLIFALVASMLMIYFLPKYANHE